MPEGNDKARRVDIGFSGGQVLALRLKADVYEALRKDLESDRSSRWHEVKSEDSDVSVDLSQSVALDAGYRYREIIDSGSDPKDHSILGGIRFKF